MTRPVDGSGPVGTGSGGPPPPSSSIAYNPVAPDTSTNVQDALDWRASHVGSQVIVDNFDDVDRIFGPAVADVWTIDKTVLQTSDFSFPVDGSGVIVPGGSWLGAAQDIGLFGNVNGPLLSGDLILNRFTIGNFSVAPLAKDIEAFSTIDRYVAIDNVIFVGTVAGSIHDVFIARIAGCSYAGLACTMGHTVSGTNGPIAYSVNTTAGVAVGFGAIQIDATVTSPGIALVGCTFDLQDPTQYGIAIADAIVLPAGATIQVVSMVSVPGPTGTGAVMLRQDPGDMSVNDLRIVVDACPDVAAWSSVGLAFRDDPSNPLTVNLSSTNPQVVPYREGVTLPETELLSPKRASLEKDAGDNFNTYVEYSGSKRDVEASACYRISVRRALGGSNNLRTVMQRNDAPLYSGFVDVEGSSTVTTNTTTFDESSGGAPVVVSPGDRFRLVVEDLDGATDAQVAVVQYGIEAQS